METAHSMKEKFAVTYGWDEILFNPETGNHEYWVYNNELREHVFSHDMPESDFSDYIPELGDFEYLYSAQFWLKITTTD